MFFKYIFFLCIFFINLNFLALGENLTLKLVTWNLENMMSQEYFVTWQKYCSKQNWQSLTSSKPKNISYCDAHNGKDFLTGKQKFLALHDWSKFSLKINALKQKASQIDADIYAFQEFTDISALSLILSTDIYDFFATNAPTSQNLGFAVKKSLNAKINFSVFEKLAIKSKSTYLTKPAAEILVKISNLKFKILNLHLKSGCKNYILDAPQFKSNTKTERKNSVINSCKILRQQLPILKNWVTDNNKQKIAFVILGDFNRLFLWEFSQFFRYKVPPRLKNSDSLELGSPITPKTKLAFIFFELSHSDINFDQLVISFEKRNVKTYLGSQRCLYGNDYILYNKRFLNLVNNIKNLDSDSILTTTTDYGDQNYGVNKALPSDHCPLEANISLKIW